MHAEGLKHDQDKARWDLLPWRAASEVVDVLTFGAQKYAPDNWRRVKGWRWRYFAAAIRHIVAWWRGEKRDPETGRHHLAHGVCCILFILELELEGEGRR